MSNKVWTFDPHSGGKPVSVQLRAAIAARLEAHGAKHYAGKYTRLEVRFRGALCYIEAYERTRKRVDGLLAKKRD